MKQTLIRTWFWRIAFAVIGVSLGASVLLVSIWRRVEVQVSERITPLMVNESIENYTDGIGKDLSPELYFLPEPKNLPQSWGYIQETSREWWALWLERDSLAAVDRRIHLAELRMAAALRLAQKGEQALAMETAAKGVVYLSRAAEGLVEQEKVHETGRTWVSMHETAKKLLVALEDFRTVMPVEWRSTVDGWIDQVQVVRSQSYERVVRNY